MPNKPKWGLRDCAIRLIYKLTSQKLISFVFAAGAILILVVLSRTAKALDPACVTYAIGAIRDIAIALLAVRGVQGITGIFTGKNKEGQNADSQGFMGGQVVQNRNDNSGGSHPAIPIR